MVKSRNCILELEQAIQSVIDKFLPEFSSDGPTMEEYASSMEKILEEIKPAMNEYMTKRPSDISIEEWYCSYFNNFHLK